MNSVDAIFTLHQSVNSLRLVRHRAAPGPRDRCVLCERRLVELPLDDDGALPIFALYRAHERVAMVCPRCASEGTW
jgi:hypothetical protein